MIEINNIIVEKKILTEYFLCDISQCRGECCTFPGEFGAPVADNEVEILNSQVEITKDILSNKSLNYIKNNGVLEKKIDRHTTVCIDKRDCVFVYYDKNIALCSIEKKYFDGKTSFRKPISCWLFPIRIANYKDKTYLYYEEIKECSSAVRNGENKNIKIYQMLKEPLIKFFGIDWYIELERTASNL